ncbi:hypothetical protein KY284_020417 [Solanum tuberosum]|nr:hypothetical protein KY284_020417 [Solanum tuberosum]
MDWERGDVKESTGSMGEGVSTRGCRRFLWNVPSVLKRRRHSLTFSSHIPTATRYGLDYFIGCTSLEILAHGTKSWSGFFTRQIRLMAWLRLCVAPLQ